MYAGASDGDGWYGVANGAVRRPCDGAGDVDLGVSAIAVSAISSPPLLSIIRSARLLLFIVGRRLLGVLAVKTTHRRALVLRVADARQRTRVTDVRQRIQCADYTNESEVKTYANGNEAQACVGDCLWSGLRSPK